MGLSTTYTKVETDFLLQKLESELVNGINGEAKTTDTPPTTGFYRYIVHEEGTYTNFKNASNAAIVVTSGDLAITNGVQANDVFIEVLDNVAKKVVYVKKGDTGVGVVLDEQIKEMLLSESYMPQNATYTDGIINSPFNIIWANGATGAITVTRNTDGLVTNISATHIKDSITKTITAVITRNTDGNATNITISII